MSVYVTRYVWEHSRVSGTKLLVLLALADFATDEGLAWPSIEALAQKARISVRNAQYILRELEEAGEIEITRNAGRGKTNLYRIVCEKVQGLAPFEGERVQEVAPFPVDGGIEKVQPIAPFEEKVQEVSPFEEEKVQDTAPFTANGDGEKVQPVAPFREKKVQSGAKKVQTIAPGTIIEPSIEPPSRDGAASVDAAPPSRSPPKSSGKKRGTGKDREFQRVFMALARVCVLDHRLNAPKIGRFAQRLRKAGYTGEDVDAFGRWWRQHDWRGRRGDPPTLEQLIELIARAKEGGNGSGSGVGGTSDLEVDEQAILEDFRRWQEERKRMSHMQGRGVAV